MLTADPEGAHKRKRRTVAAAIAAGHTAEREGMSPEPLPPEVRAQKGEGTDAPTRCCWGPMAVAFDM